MVHTLRDLAGRRLQHWSRPLVPLELMHLDDLHYLVHLLIVTGCSPMLVRRIKLFDALARDCTSCCLELSSTAFLNFWLHFDEIPRYWSYFRRIARGRILRRCTCQPLESCPFSPALPVLDFL